MNSSIMGFMQSRLYIGDWNLRFEQSFELTFAEGSWAHWYRRQPNPGLPLTVFNSTSVAAYTISKHIQSINKIRFAWREFLSGRL